MNPKFYDYGARQPRKRKMKGNHRGICRDCGKSQMVSNSAWYRAARPTCYECGGLLQPSEAASEEFTRQADAARGRPEPDQNLGYGVSE